MHLDETVAKDDAMVPHAVTIVTWNFVRDCRDAVWFFFAMQWSDIRAPESPVAMTLLTQCYPTGLPF
jgi:hypothetical protein